MKATCPFCKREFRTHNSLGLHQWHVRRASAKAKRLRLCPDRRSDDEARDTALRIVRLKAKLGLGAFARGGR